MRGSDSLAVRYLPAIGLGIAAAAWMLPWATVAGSAGLWAAPGGDAAVSLTGHLAYQTPGWHWPLLIAPDLAWPEGRSIALTDSNPLVSICAKLLSFLIGQSVNLLGAWLAICWILQPVAAVFAFRAFAMRTGICCRWEACIAVAALSLLCPAWLMRARHVNLLGHFLLLTAFGWSLRLQPARSRHWTLAGLLLCAAILTHPYMYVFAAIMLSAPIIHALTQHGRMPWRVAGLYAACCAAPIGLLVLLSGAGGANASGFGHYSMNLLSPVWPQRSGLFGADLPILDATGGQYEGFNYLGGGVLLLVGVAVVMLAVRPPSGSFRALRAWLAPIWILAALALSPHVYAGHVLLIDLPLQPWRGLFAAVQSSGRAFWLVGYTVMIGAVAVVSRRLGRWPATALLAAACVLQAIDTAPIRASAASLFAGHGQATPPFTMIAGASLLRIVPPCDPVSAPADQLRLLAIRAGLHLADMRMARAPAGFDCGIALSDGLELPLAPSEMRFFLPSAEAALRIEPLGQASCARLPAGILCTGKILAKPSGQAVPPGAALAGLPARAVGDALAGLVATGWRRGADGAFWSEGPIATLLFRVPDDASAIVLEMDAVAWRAGGERSISVQVGDAPPAFVTLTDARRTRMRLAVPRGPIRVAFGLKRPVEVSGRRLSAPVRRAALRLYGIEEILF